ncbi:hypothetical protein MPSEU_000309400 [Mayamaea pseudoterrestris]|nr:hypothetical protein MPSEU_000309400 [Mayamaea pseudoterrestris]
MVEGSSAAAATEQPLLPLQNDWVLWEHKSGQSSGGNKDKANSWKDNMSELAHFGTVQDVWNHLNHLPLPSLVFFDGETKKKVGPTGKTVEEYSLFKKGIEPEWGDKQNISGGEWFCRQYLEPETLDLFWSNLVFGIVGEVIEDGADEDHSLVDHINGVRVVDKSRGYPLYKLEIWLNTKDAKITNRIKNKVLEVIMDGQQSSKKMHPKFEWKDHS